MNSKKDFDKDFCKVIWSDALSKLGGWITILTQESTRTLMRELVGYTYIHLHLHSLLKIFKGSKHSFLVQLWESMRMRHFLWSSKYKVQWLHVLLCIASMFYQLSIEMKLHVMCGVKSQSILGLTQSNHSYCSISSRLQLSLTVPSWMLLVSLEKCCVLCICCVVLLCIIKPPTLLHRFLVRHPKSEMGESVCICIHLKGADR